MTNDLGLKARRKGADNGSKQIDSLDGLIQTKQFDRQKGMRSNNNNGGGEKNFCSNTTGKLGGEGRRKKTKPESG